MNIILCPNNHHYDADEFEACPHCPQDASPVKKQTCEPREESKSSPEFEKRRKPEKKMGLLKYLFLPSKEEETVTDERFDDVNEVKSYPFPTPKIVIDDKKDSDTSGYFDWEPEPEKNKMSDDNSLVLGDTTPKRENLPKKIVTEDYFNDRHKPERDNYEDVYSSSEKEHKVKDEKEVSELLKENIKNVASRTEGKTLGYFEKKEKKESIENGDKHTTFTEPVVGWIVAIAGPHFGESFPIVSGQNSIGRSSVNKIVISKDNSVSREKHAQLIYDPKGLNFFLRAGESSGLVYLNGECFFDVRKLTKKDVIMLGESEFVFIPLCDESFSWESYLERK